MTSKTLTNAYPAGYAIAPGTTYVTVAPTGYVGGTGIVGGNAAAYTVVNLGSVNGDPAGISLGDGGSVTNGTVSDTTVALRGYFNGVAINGAEGTVLNYGQIMTTQPGEGILLGAGGYVKNGAGGLISSGEGVKINGEAGTVVNLGDIVGARSFLAGVYFSAGGAVTNGNRGDTWARIEGAYGVSLENAPGTVTNFGSIFSDTGTYSGVSLGDGGGVTNGTGADTSALIAGSNGVYVDVLKGTVVNFATIEGEQDDGVQFLAGGPVTNGSATDRTALIEGYGGGVYVSGGGDVTNFATIEARGATEGYGVALAGGGSLVNGAVNDTSALIEGFGGASLEGAGSSVNFGTIEGLGNAAPGAGVTLGGVGARLANGAAADASALIEGFIGAELGGTTTLTNFGTIEGANGVAVQVDSPTCVLVVEAGSSFIGAVNGDGGTLDLASGSETITGALSGDGVMISGAIATSTFNDFGAIDVNAGATVDLSGTIAVPGDVTVSGEFIVGTAGATLAGAGAFVFTDSATNEITGATAASTLTNDTRLAGAGELGDGSMKLVNAAGGVINGDQTIALVINTGANTILNAGNIGSSSTGGVTISSALANTGLLVVSGAGTLDVAGAVSGAGSVRILAGTAEFGATFTENVDFIDTTGVLELAKSQTYAGEITGFSKTGATALDLLDIPFVSGTTKAVFTGTTTSGVLTVSEGTNVARITLEGDYVGSTFTVSAGPGGGTKVVDPAGAAAPTHIAAPLSPHPFIAAMARFGAPKSGGPALDGHFWSAPAPTLATPRTATT
jgi:hypothetical protein